MLVYERTEADFIPWFSSYWTRQWLTMKVTWYQLNAEGEKDPVVDRLAFYLQEQYQDRVLEPVAKQISPDWIMAQATQLYIRLMREQLQAIAPRYAVPAEQFDSRLQAIPAIALAPPPPHSASLYQMLNAEPIDGQPAYVALVEQIHATLGGAGDWSADAGISSVAKQTSKRLTNELATGGVASAVAALVGRAAGLVISLGTSAFSRIVGENQRPKREAQLRQSLHAAFDEEWLDLMHNPGTGVLAGIYQLSGKIEGSLAHSVRSSVPFEPAAQGLRRPDEPSLQHEKSDDEALGLPDGVESAPDQLW
jgi:hypothetical protein